MFERNIDWDQDKQNLTDELEVGAQASPPSLASPAVIASENPGFELPRAIWVGMFSCYAIFFIGLFVGTGGSSRAIFAIVISVLYAAMYFGLSRVLARQAGPEKRSPLERGKSLQTWCGPMKPDAVYGQVLIVPVALAFFGVSIAIVIAIVT